MAIRLLLLPASQIFDDVVLLSFQQRLLAFADDGCKTTLHVYSTHNKSWVPESSPSQEISHTVKDMRTDHILLEGFRGICQATVKGIQLGSLPIFL